MEHMTVLTTAIDTTFNPGIAAYGHAGTVHIGLVGDVGIGSYCGVSVLTLAGTEDMTHVIGTAWAGHQHVVGTHFGIAVDDNGTDARTWVAGCGLAQSGWWYCCRTGVVCTYRALVSSTIDATADILAAGSHLGIAADGDIGVLGYVGIVSAAED